jgi:hypothetical protein
MNVVSAWRVTLGTVASGLSIATGVMAMVDLAGCALIADLQKFDNAVSATVDAESPAEGAPGVTDDATDPSADDEASPSTDDSALEGSVDVTTDSSVTTATDAGADTTQDAGATSDSTPEAGTWCARNTSANTFDCHDFDETGDSSAGFTNHLLSSWGELAVVTSTDYAPGSPPNSLLISTPAIDAGGYAIDQYNDVLLYHNKFELRFATKIVNYDSSAGVVSLIRMSYQNNGWAETLDLQGNTTTLDESWTGNGKAAHSVTMLPLDSWVDVDLVVDLNGHTQSLTFNGVSALTVSTISNPNQSNPALFVQAGLNYLGGPAKAMSIYCDDIEVNTPP